MAIWYFAMFALNALSCALMVSRKNYGVAVFNAWMALVTGSLYVLMVSERVLS